MNTTISMLLAAPVFTALAPQSVGQETDPAKVASPSPRDVSVEGLVEATRGAPGDPARVGNLAVTIGPATRLECARRIRDDATGECLMASSLPTSGALLPYPGINSLFTPPSVVSGGYNNSASGRLATVGGGGGNKAFGDGATVGGGNTNMAEGAYSTVGGGYRNTALLYGSTVGGGGFNKALGYRTTVSGGDSNTAYSNYATVGGGVANTAYGWWATVAGGAINMASTTATVSGGAYNTAAGNWATVPGGSNNTAQGYFSFAAGHRAKAGHRGAFVWGDSFNYEKPSSQANEFNVYASGGVRMFTNFAADTGVLLAPGGSTWTMVSDRNAKENVAPVDARAVLDKVAELPVATWNYKEQDDSIRHMGPMAQDFYAAFGLGLGERTIDTIDPNGVALAAIQGLNEVVQENERRLAEKDAQIEELRASLERLEARVASAK